MPEHEGALAGELEAEGFGEYLEAEVVGIVAAQASVGQAGDGVDVAHALGHGREFVQIGEDGLFVRDGDVHALPLRAGDEALELAGLALEPHILKARELAVDGGRVAMTQHASEHTVRSVHVVSFRERGEAGPSPAPPSRNFD